MFRSQVAVVWFLFFFLVCNAGDQEVAAETLEFSSKDIFVQTLSVRVKEWDERIEKGSAGVSLRFLDRYCANVMDVVKELEPKLRSATLSCDIDHTQRPEDIRVDNIKVELAVLSNEMKKLFSSETWSPSLKNTLESGNVNVNSAWIIDIVSVSDPTAVGRESYLFQKTYPTSSVTTDKCPELKIIMSNIYTGFGETMTNCFFDVSTGDISTTMDYRELMKKGYCCSEHNVYRRIYWSIYELLYKGESGDNTIKITQPEITIDKKNTTLDGKTTVEKEISQPGTTTDKKETSLGLPSIIRISELENLEVNYTGHCIYASFPSGSVISLIQKHITTKNHQSFHTLFFQMTQSNQIK